MQEDKILLNFKLSGRTISNLVYSLNDKYQNVGIYIKKDGRVANAHSILGVLSLSIEYGDTIIVSVNSSEMEFKEIYSYIKSKLE